MKNIKKAAGATRAAFGKLTHGNFTKNRTEYIHYFDRNLLPSPANYYSKQFSNLRIKSEWLNVHCVFHEDRNPSLAINMVHGSYHCFSCGAHGGDILDFQMQYYRQTFIEAVTALNAWEV